jgi:hypothetical protein
MKIKYRSHFWSVVWFHLQMRPWMMGWTALLCFFFPIFMLWLTQVFQYKGITGFPGIFPGFLFAMVLTMSGTPYIWGAVIQNNRGITLVPEQLGNEFLFTTAVNRKSIFRAKSFLFYGLFLLPFVFIFIYLVFDPNLKLELIERDQEEAKSIIARYENSFPGTQVVSQKGGRVTLAIPGVKPLMVGRELLLGGIIILLFQWVLFQSWGHRWQGYLGYLIILPFALLPVATLFLENKSIESRWNYENQLIWLSHHGWLMALILLIAAIAVYRFTQRRFLNLEML